MSHGVLETSVQLIKRIRTRIFTLLISGAFKKCGFGTRIEPPFRFFNLGQISLGRNVMINRNCWIQVLEDQVKSQDPKLIIESNAAIGMDATISVVRKVVIGEYVLLARNVYISDHSHAFSDIRVPIMDQGIDHVAAVIIGRHTWLGQNVVVLPGVSIGEHCVIGANSVVNSSIADFSVAAGVPARVVKRFNHEIMKWQRIK